MPSDLEFLPVDHPLQRVGLKAQFRRAQENLLPRAFSTAADLCAAVFQQLKVAIPVAGDLAAYPPTKLTDESFSELLARFDALLRKAGVPDQSVPLQAFAIAERVQLVGAFENLEAAIGLHFAYYNLVRVHRTLRATPAMVAGLLTEPLLLRDLVELAN